MNPNKIIFCGGQSNRTAEHQSSYNTADFTYEEKQDTLRRNEERRITEKEFIADKKTLEILNYYNRSMNSEISQENLKENKMLKDALYATIKLVLDQNKQIKKLKEAVTHRRIDNSIKNDASLVIGGDESFNPDLSLLSLSKDAINPIVTVNNFMKEHMPTEKGSSKSEFFRFKSEDRKLKGQANKSDISKISQNDADSVNEVILHSDYFRPFLKNLEREF